MNAKPLFAGLLGLLALASCSGETLSSGSSVSSETSETDITSSSECVSLWPEADIAEFVSSVLGSDVAIPSPSEALDGGRSYEVEIDGDAISITAEGDFTGYIDEVLSSGWIEVITSMVYGDVTHLHSPDGEIAIEIGAYDGEADTIS